MFELTFDTHSRRHAGVIDLAPRMREHFYNRRKVSVMWGVAAAMALASGYASEDDVSVRLAALGLKIEYPQEAIRAGEEARRTWNPTEPPNAGGLKDWIARVGSLREQLVQYEGWRTYNHQQMALAVNGDKTIALGVLQGDSATGRHYGPKPKSKYPKGRVFEDLTARNQLALFSLGEAGALDQLEDEELARLQTWVLLTYRTKANDRIEVYSEISLPKRIGPGGLVDDWIDRIILPRLDFEGVIELGSDSGDDDFDVPVEEL